MEKKSSPTGIIDSQSSVNNRLRKEGFTCMDMRKFPLSTQDIYIQPISLTFLPACLNQGQFTLIYALTEFLQSRLYGLLFENKMLFCEEGGEVVRIVLPRTSLCIPPEKYSGYISSAYELQNLPLDYFVWDESFYGYRWKELVLIREIICIKWEHTITIVLDRAATEMIFQMKQYTCCVRQTLRACKTTRSKRLYLFVSTYRLYGLRRIMYEDFLKQMGFSVSKRRVGGKGNLSYSYFSEFYRAVLNPARKELQILAEKGYADCYFKVSVDYPRGKKKGNPIWLNFHILHTPGVPSILSSLPPTPYQDILDFMVDSLDIARARAKYILSSVTDEDVYSVRLKVKHLRNMLDDGHQVLKIGPWAATSIMNMLNDLRNKKTAKEVVQKQNLTVNLRRPPIADEVIQKWTDLNFYWQARLNPGVFDTYFSKLRIHSYGQDEVLHLYIPDAHSKNYITTNLKALAPGFYQFFPGMKGIVFHEESDAYLLYNI